MTPAGLKHSLLFLSLQSRCIQCSIMIRQPDSAMPTRGSSTVQELSLARRLHTSLSVSAPRLSEFN